MHPWQVARDTLLAVVGAVVAYRAYRVVRQKGLKKAAFGLVLSVAGATSAGKAAIKADTAKTIAKLAEQMRNKDAAGDDVLVTIPSKGKDKAELLKVLQRWQQCERKHWNSGQLSGGIYHGGDDLTAFLTEVYGMFSLSNPLHTDVFPFVRKMEAEVVRMTVSLFQGGPECCGTMTSGGTESILMAVKSYRDRSRTQGITEPEIICGVSAHAAFDKACHYFQIKMVHVPVDPVSMRVDVSAVRKAITSNTILIVGSAPGFPHGVVDPIEELAALAKSKGIGMHVDSCLGGYLLPFAVKLGYDIPKFDFSVSGVTSISADTHKYGYAPKGASVVMYNDSELRAHQYFVATDWTGGIYASPSMPGSRPGGLIAGTWAALVLMGEEGYLKCAKEILQTAKEIEAGLRQIKGIRVLGTPHMSVVSFASDEDVAVRGVKVNIYKVGESLTAAKMVDGVTRPGWNLNTLQKPSSIHICCTYMHRGLAKQFCEDVQAAVDQVVDNPNMFKNGSAAIYGTWERSRHLRRCLCVLAAYYSFSARGVLFLCRNGRVAPGRQPHRGHGSRIHRHALPH